MIRQFAMLNLLGELARIEDETKIIRRFTDVLNNVWPAGAFCFHAEKPAPDKSDVIQIATSRNIFGYLSFLPQEITSSDKACLNNVSSLLGVIPENNARLKQDAARAREKLGWAARRDLDQMCADAWRWQEKNPRGYE